MRKTRYQRNEIDAELILFTDAARAEKKSDSYAAGYYESLLGRLLADLPKNKQEEILQQLRVQTASFTK